MHYVQSADRNQTLLFSSLDDFIPKEHPVRIIDAIVNNIIKSNSDKFKYKGEKNIGRRAYSPNAMIKLFLYGYLNSISSSRKLEVETHRNIELKWLLGNLQPDHKTIANYRKDNYNHIEFVTIEFRKFLKACGYIKCKTVAIDGSKVKANANREVLTIEKIEKRLSKLDDNLKKYLDKLAETDIKEDSFDEIDGENSGSINEHLVEKIKFLQSKIEKLEKAKADIEILEKKYFSPTDPEANLMKTRDGIVPAYNVQVMADSENHMITESQVSTSANDLNELTPMVSALEKNIGSTPEEILGDNGYYNSKEIKKLEEEKNITCFIPAGERGGKIKFNYNEEKDEYICPLGKRLVLTTKNRPKGGRFASVYQGIECEGCPWRSKCTKSKYGRIVHRYSDHDWVESYKKRVSSNFSKKKIKKRKTIVEHVFGTIKYWMGQIPVLLRGKDKVQTEINIYTTAYNLKRLINIENFDALMEMIENYEWKKGRNNMIIPNISLFIHLLIKIKNYTIEKYSYCHFSII